jgi:hypothetical protein
MQLTFKRGIMKFVSRITFIGLAIAIVAGSGIAVAKSPHQGRPALRREGKVPPSTVRPDQTSSIPKGYTVVHSELISSPAGTETYGAVLCPPLTVVLGGGVYITDRALDFNVNSSYPAGSTGWIARVNNATFDGFFDTTFTVYAICAKQPRNYAVVSATFPNPTGLTSAEVACPVRSKVLGGGSYSNSRSSGGAASTVNISSTFPNGKNVWSVRMASNDSSPAQVTVFAVCGNSKGRTVYSGSAVSIPEEGESLSSVSCPAGQVPSGGGEYSSATGNGVFLNSTYPDGATWNSYENNLVEPFPYPSTQSWVICVGGP